MMEQLLEWDRELFFYLNSMHSSFMDTTMWYISNKYTWFPLYILLGLLIIRQFGLRSIIWLAGIALALTFADQLTSSVMKPFFARWRPSRDPAFEDGIVHVIRTYRGGKYGFASSHAANVFAVAVYVHLLLRPYYRWTWILFLYATLVAYSRIYLGVHYPGDILAGACIGSLLAIMVYVLIRWALRKRSGTSVK